MSIKTVLALVLVLSVTACASNAPTNLIEPGSGKATITQVGRNQNAQFVFCETNRCPERTVKVLPTPLEPVAKKEVVAPVVAVQKAPEPKKYKVHFRWGYSTLDAAGQKEVSLIVADLKDQTATRILVAGRTDPTGPKSFNEKLAVKRAEVVKAALAKSGQPVSVITAQAQTPCCDGELTANAKAMQEKRRTDIDVTIQTK